MCTHNAEQRAAFTAQFANVDMVKANEDVVLVHPFTPGHPSNSWLPELEPDVQAMWWVGAADKLRLATDSWCSTVLLDGHAGLASYEDCLMCLASARQVPRNACALRAAAQLETLVCWWGEGDHASSYRLVKSMSR